MENTRGINRKAFAFILMTAFLGAMGLGLMAPVAPFLVMHYVPETGDIGAAVGWLTSVYAVCELLAAPALGALSDRFGRRPLLLICLFGSAIGYLLLGIGGALWVLFLGRIIDGLTGGNNGIINAFVADITEPAERGKYYGWIGAVAGVGFILGPAIGGLLAKFGYEAPFYFAAVITFANVLYGLFAMPETLPQTARSHAIPLTHLNPLSALNKALSMSQLRWLLLTMFLYVIPFMALQANVSLYVNDTLGWDADTTGIILSLFGVMSIFVQAVLLQWLLKRFSEVQVAMGGAVFSVAAYILFAALVVVNSPVPLITGLIVFAAGEGFLNPALGGMISRAAGPQSQGEVQGGAQSITSFASIIGPLLGGVVYDRIGHATPYVGGALFCLLALGGLVLALPGVRQSLKEPSGV